MAATYRALRDKMGSDEFKRGTPKALAAVIDYWIARLQDDRSVIAQSTRPRSISAPAQTPSVKGTYQVITDKLMSVGGKASSKADLIKAIDYWMARLEQDRQCIAAGVPLVRYPEPP